MRYFQETTRYGNYSQRIEQKSWDDLTSAASRSDGFVSIPIFTGSFGSGMASWLFHCEMDSEVEFGIEFSNVNMDDGPNYYFINVDEDDTTSLGGRFETPNTYGYFGPASR